MITQKPIAIGVIADDFTGGSDAASFLAESGAKTVLYNGLPKDDAEGCDAVVIALKTRSVNPKEAVGQSLAAVQWLNKKKAAAIYFKYCSTFDSTPKGNIGPVLDSILVSENLPYTILCPSLPVNGRTVKNGALFVNGVPLDESPMKDHPLNPMWSASISQLMQEQSGYPCIPLPEKEMVSKERIDNFIQKCAEKYPRFYIIPDYVTDMDGKKIAAYFQHLKVLSGGSGLLMHLYQGPDQRLDTNSENSAAGRTMILCGSCSKATKDQIAHYQASGGSSISVNAKKLLDGAQTFESIGHFIKNSSGTVMVYSDGAVLEGALNQTGKEGMAIEQTMAALGKLAVEQGFSRVVVAGGETSGAVMLALGYNAYYIGQSIDPGVPELIPVKNGKLRVILKSGNFGQVDFFERAAGRQ